MRILTPRSRGAMVWAYTSNFGGGMVAGDKTRLELRVDAGARCFLGTQASTKIYRNPDNLPCSHHLWAHLGENAFLILTPDPVQCFAESSYEQSQHFVLSRSANLILVDWMSAGRSPRGERWNFRRYSSRNVIEREGRELLVEAVLLDEEDGALASPFRGGRFNCLAFVALFGPVLAGFAKAILDGQGAQPITPGAALLSSASARAEGLLLRLAGASAEEVGRAIHKQLGFVRQLFEDDPWSRKW
jgi:urease accessory protein